MDQERFMMIVKGDDKTQDISSYEKDHENNPEQLKRDEKKEEIFKKFGMKLERFRTNESGEEQRISELLSSMLYKME
ncbi:hypothetical protein [Paenibacillus sp. MDMC362]|uniref:hypothetical protein n=1 Tax=Paenibacillus sp. MDMC362 TaxID=2977365 RepID=UPI000DC3EB64|nr:hypothetical protein [Paenibacillus sp. MDMC362]RAR39401.1 hypothetical protein DP091_30425 [Paenibacillus sp. MDMC362]